VGTCKLAFKNPAISSVRERWPQLPVVKGWTRYSNGTTHDVHCRPTTMAVVMVMAMVMVV
jgi:hypothetical protein